MQEEHLDITTKALSKALREVFGTGKRTKRFVDVSRIPLLCRSVIEIREDIRGIKESVVDLSVKIENTVKKESLQDEQESKREAWREKWTDRIYTLVLNAIVFIIVLILMRTKIIDLTGFK